VEATARVQEQSSGPTYVGQQPEKTVLYFVMQVLNLPADVPKLPPAHPHRPPPGEGSWADIHV
jgi:hypothetical protein